MAIPISPWQSPFLAINCSITGINVRIRKRYLVIRDFDSVCIAGRALVRCVVSPTHVAFESQRTSITPSQWPTLLASWLAASQRGLTVTSSDLHAAELMDEGYHRRPNYPTNTYAVDVVEQAWQPGRSPRGFKAMRLTSLTRLESSCHSSASEIDCQHAKTKPTACSDLSSNDCQ